MDVVTVTSPDGLWTTILKPWVQHRGRRHLGFWPSPSWLFSVTILIFGRRHLGLWPSPSWSLAVAISVFSHRHTWFFSVAILVFGHLVFLQPEVTRDGGAKYNRTLNKFNSFTTNFEFLDLQNCQTSHVWFTAQFNRDQKAICRRWLPYIFFSEIRYRKGRDFVLSIKL